MKNSRNYLFTLDTHSTAESHLHLPKNDSHTHKMTITNIPIASRT